MHKAFETVFHSSYRIFYHVSGVEMKDTVSFDYLYIPVLYLSKLF